jgi:hypothetical protein
MSGQKSLFVTLSLTTTNTKLSPVLDVQRISAFTIQNRLNNPTSANTPNLLLVIKIQEHLVAQNTLTNLLYLKMHQHL